MSIEAFCRRVCVGVQRRIQGGGVGGVATPPFKPVMNNYH